MGYLPSILVLGLAAIVSLFLTRSRVSTEDLRSERTSAAWALVIATVLQAIHFGEELSTGFHTELGELLNIPAMSSTFFIVFNISWLIIWAVAVVGIRRGHNLAYFAAWFLSVAGMTNAVAHPVLSLVGGTYFPGTISAPFIGVACFWLFLKLRRSTRLSGA